MGSIWDKLAYTKKAREEIRAVIVENGVDCPGKAPFCSFDDYIRLAMNNGGGNSGGSDGESCNHFPKVRLTEGGYVVAFVSQADNSIVDTYPGFSTMGKVSIGTITTTVEPALVVLQQTIAAADLSKWTYDSDRYIHVVDSNVKLKTSWSYVSEEQEIDSGRMAIVKALIADLSHVNSLEVNTNG
jgi:hypothetical protein